MNTFRVLGACLLGCVVLRVAFAAVLVWRWERDARLVAEAHLRREIEGHCRIVTPLYDWSGEL